MSPHFPRYLLVGIANTLLDLVLFSVLAIGAQVPSLLAHAMSTVVVVTVSFFINRGWVFASSASAGSTMLPFVTVTVFSAFLVQSAVIATVLNGTPLVTTEVSDTVLLPVAKVFAMGTGMLVNYFGYRAVFSRVRP